MKKVIQRRVVAFDSLKLRENLKKKIKPMVGDPRIIPMPVAIKLIEFDGSLLKKFSALNHDFRKRILKQLFADFKIVIERLKGAYVPVLEYETCRLESSPI